MGKFDGKVLLVLGSNVGSVDIVQYAKSNGAKVLVADYYLMDKSEAKRFSDKNFLVSTADLEELGNIIKKYKVGEINEYERKRLNTYIDEASYFLCVGNPLKEAIKKISNTQRKIYVVPNIVSDEFRYVCPQRKQYYEFVTVGRLVKIKQFDKVIETFNREFGNEQKNVKLIIIGDGKERKELERIVKRNNLQNVVRFTGRDGIGYCNYSEWRKSGNKSDIGCDRRSQYRNTVRLRGGRCSFCYSAKP